eukprot:TRINITY_DN7713_c0_g1_i2.p1 TRINITY_DN7713_c0_g1~~TRINITY_DN7713_c0_g1_i2.p1  ORF type:complete len:292 (-),score=45.94 TRINITY_DN7713_c0_g1_i2:175-1050(-)
MRVTPLLVVLFALLCCFSSAVDGGHYSKKQHNQQSLVSPAALPFECPVCKLLVGFIEKEVLANKTTEQIEADLSAYCKELPTVDQSVCAQLFQVGIPQIVEMIKNHENSTTICTQISLCGTEASTANSDDGNDDVDAFPFECSLCHMLVGFIEKEVLENKTIAEIEADLKVYCDKLPKEDQSVCQQLYQVGIPQIVDMIKKHEDAATICVQISMCDKSEYSVCDQCRTLAIAAEMMVSKLVTPSEVYRALTHVDNVNARVKVTFWAEYLLQKMKGVRPRDMCGPAHMKLCA